MKTHLLINMTLYGSAICAVIAAGLIADELLRELRKRNGRVM